jgi:paraquat-inducible protein A
MLSSARPDGPLVACHDCDATQVEPPLKRGGSAHCWRCGAVLARVGRCGIEGGVALATAALLCFVIAHSFPVAKVVLHGKAHEPTFMGAMAVVAAGGHALLASIVFVTLVIIPLAQILLALYLLLPVWQRRVPPAVGLAFRLFHELRPWSQLDILALGIVVALGKMSRYAEISVGVTVPALAGAIILPILGTAALEGPYYWAQIGRLRGLLAAPSRSAPAKARGAID